MKSLKNIYQAEIMNLIKDRDMLNAKMNELHQSQNLNLQLLDMLSN